MPVTGAQNDLKARSVPLAQFIIECGGQVALAAESPLVPLHTR
jgi:hypothetical protein